MASGDIDCCAPLGQRRSGKRSTHHIRCQTSDKMAVRAACSASSPSATSPSSTARARVRARPERPDRRDRRRQVHPGRGGRPAGRRPRLRRPGPDRRGTRRRSRRSSRRRRRRADRPPRDLGAGPQPRASSTARWRRSAALRELSAPLVDLHGQHEHQALLDPATHLDLLDAFAGLAAERAARRAPRSRAWQALARRARPARAGRTREGARAPSSSRSSSPRSIAPRPQPGEDEELAATRQVLANAERLQRLCAEAYTALYEATRRRCRRSAASGSGSASWRRSIPQFRRTSTARDGDQVAARGSRVLPALVLGGDRRVAGAAAGGRGSPRAARAAEEEARADARRRHRATGASSPASWHDSSTRRERAAELDARARARASRRLSRARRGAVGEAAPAAARRSAARSRRRSPSWRWPARAARSGSRRRAAGGAVDRRGASTQAEFYISPNPGEDLRPLARIASGGELSRIMLALKTLASTDAPGKTLIFDEVDAGIGGAVADVVGARLQRAGGAVPGALHHPPAADRRLRRARTSASRSASRTGRTVTARRPARRRRAGRRAGADDRRRRGLGSGPGERARDAGARRADRHCALTGECKSERRKRKSQTERKRNSNDMARKYFIETFGCQMNVHDSERMAGLLEQAGYEPTADDRDADVVVINTCSVRERAEEKLFTRLGEIRVSWALETGHAPIVAVAGCVAQQEGAQILQALDAPSTSSSARRHLKRLPMLLQSAIDAPGAGVPAVDLDPLDDVSFPLGVTRRSDPVKAYVTIIEGCNEFCAFCVVPVHARPRADAAGGRHPRRGAPGGRRPAPAKSSCSGRSSITTRRRTTRRATSRRCSSGCNEIDGLERIRFASPHPRHVTPRMIEAMRELPKVCRHLHLPVQSGSTRVLAAMRRRHTREELPRAGRRAPRRHAGHRALDRYDRRLPRRDGGGLRGDAVADRARSAITACSRSSTRRGRTRSPLKRHAGRRAGGGEDAADRGAAGAAAGDPGGAVSAGGRPDVERCWSTRAAGGATGSCRAARAATRS